MVIEANYFIANAFVDGIALVSLAEGTDEDRWIFIDKNGKVVSATNFESQIICELPLAGIQVDPADLERVRPEVKALEDRMNNKED